MSGDDNEVSPTCPAWLPPVAITVAMALAGVAITVYTTVAKNSDRITRLEEAHAAMDKDGSRSAIQLRVEVDALRKELDHVVDRQDRVVDRLNSLHQFISQNPLFRPKSQKEPR